jgi:hypothetical protein
MVLITIGEKGNYDKFMSAVKKQDEVLIHIAGLRTYIADISIKITDVQVSDSLRKDRYPKKILHIIMYMICVLVNPGFMSLLILGKAYYSERKIDKIGPQMNIIYTKCRLCQFHPAPR